MAQGSTAHQKDSGLRQIENRRAEYAKYLESPEWIAVREAFFQNFARRCVSCGSFDRLQLHHTTYKHIYNELEHLDDLVCLCYRCHQAEHGARLAVWRRVIRDVPCPCCGVPRGHQCIKSRRKSHKSRTKLWRSPERYEWTNPGTEQRSGRATEADAAKALARWAKKDAKCGI